MSLHRPINHPATKPARARAVRASHARRAAAPRIVARTAEEVALPSVQPGAAGRLGKMAFAVGAATLSWAGVIIIARAALG
ncbi:hypothetical protein [Sphingomonas solaris]|uniref:Uncharacterized protein n=1 Tax=Alterirhizorhabdus solaris TaxID=2529389 RepID=A0A558QVJ1_9SPHN|nr:hypothetical protein [Sphingomonas solaris]TVV71173.1 hypothetical protein FOY91_17390 [Sphingomonas solaris]